VKFSERAFQESAPATAGIPNFGCKQNSKLRRATNKEELASRLLKPDQLELLIDKIESRII
jgi:hypothetical protein